MTSGRASVPFFYMTARPPVYVCVCAAGGSSHLCVRVCVFSEWVCVWGGLGRGEEEGWRVVFVCVDGSVCVCGRSVGGGELRVHVCIVIVSITISIIIMMKLVIILAIIIEIICIILTFSSLLLSSLLLQSLSLLYSSIFIHSFIIYYRYHYGYHSYSHLIVITVSIHIIITAIIPILIIGMPIITYSYHHP